MNMSNSKKRAYFRHIFADNFFVCIFSKLFQRIRNQQTNSQETAQKKENLFLWMCLKILLGNHKRVCITKLLKSLYPIAQLSELNWQQYNWRISSAYPLSRILPTTRYQI